jgi:hypothetical protein
VKIYDCLIETLSKAPPEAWEHVLYHKFSWAKVNGVELTLYRNGWISFAGNMYGKFPFSIKGRKLFKKVRDVKQYPTSQALRAKKELEKLGYREGHDEH